MERQTATAGDEPGAHAGWLDAAARLSARLLGSARIRDDLRLIARQIDPDSTPGLVRTLLWTDTGLTMDLLGALPQLANVAIEGLRELADQLQRFPTALLAEMLSAELDRTRLHTLGRTVGKLTALAMALASQAPGTQRASASFAAGFAQEVDASSLSRAVARAIERNPELRDQLLAPLLSPILEALARPDEPGAPGVAS